MSEIPENTANPKYRLLDDEVEEQWLATLKKIEVRFGEGIEMEGIIFLIGVQELGKGYQKLKKHEKLDVMHIAICTLLEPYGYYIFEGKDPEGWPHWKLNEELPPLKPGQQKALMKQAMVEYFKDIL